MAYTYDLTTDTGKLRLLVQDNDLSLVGDEVPREQRSAAFNDAELQTLLGMQPDLYMAAALTLRTWAANKQLIVTSRKFARGEVDYGAIRADMLKAAESYETLARTIPADAIAEQAWTDFAADRLIINAWSREI